MRPLQRRVLMLIGCAALGTTGCAMFRSEVTYNPYVRNEGEKPVLRTAEDVLNAPEEALNRLDRRFERIVY